MEFKTSQPKINRASQAVKSGHAGPPWFLAVLMLFCPIIAYTEQPGVQIAPDWKAHFQSTPIVENCVFQENNTSLFQFRWQTNAFLFRQIANLAEAASNNIPATPIGYVGRFGSDSWSIAFTGDQYGTLWLFPNAGNVWDTEPTNDVDFRLYNDKVALNTVLYYGIFGIDPETLQWGDDTAFTAQVFNGPVKSKIIVNIIGASNGLPTALEWHIEHFPEGFRVEYEYDNKSSGLPYFPTEIRTYTKDLTKAGNPKTLVKVTKILELTISPTALPESLFDPHTYFAMPPPSRPLPAIILYTNGQEFVLEKNGQLSKVLSVPPMTPLESSPAEVKLIRLLLLCFLVLSGIAIWLIAGHRNKQLKQ